MICKFGIGEIVGDPKIEEVLKSVVRTSELIFHSRVSVGAEGI